MATLGEIVLIELSSLNQGFALANNTSKPMYEFLSDYPERSRRFASMMKGFTEGRLFDLKYVTDFYPWAEHSGGTIVDVSTRQPRGRAM